MKPIRYCLLLTLCGLLLAWLLPIITTELLSANSFPWRRAFLQGSGILSIGCMSVAMILAVRPVALETPLNGLDKMYRLHKWLGISALAFALLHWYIAHIPRWASLRGRGPHGRNMSLENFSVIEQFFHDHHRLAGHVGELAFYLFLVLIVLALLRRFPYHRFFKTHYFFAFVYLALVFHSVILMRFDQWASIAGILSAFLMIAGSISALIVIFRGVGRKRQAMSKVTALGKYPNTGFMSIEVEFEKPWARHQAGQFAFLSLDGKEEAHPFTIASATRDQRRLRFIIKGLGDYTRHMIERLRIGDAIRVEGPYGRFTFSGNSHRQIWIGGGIGITPFVARLEALAEKPDNRLIDLFYCSAEHDAHFVDELMRLATAVGVKLHVLHDARDGFLDAKRLMKTVPDWPESEIWFCGPVGLAQALKKDLFAQGLDESRFHQELFEMR